MTSIGQNRLNTEGEKRMSDQPTPIRRIITGHDSNNKAKVLIDGPAPNIRGNRPGQFTTLMWCSDEMPLDMAVGEDVEDMGARKLGTYPPVNGTRFMISEYPPGNHPLMHRTETVDYIIVLCRMAFVLIDAKPLGFTEHLRSRDNEHHQINDSMKG